MHSERPRPYSALIALVIGVVSTVLTTSTAATVYVASGADRLGDRGGRGADAANITIFPSDAHHRERAMESLLDSLIAPLGPLAPMDSATLRTAVALFRANRANSAWNAFDSTAARTVDTLEFGRRWARSERLPAFWGVQPGFPGLASTADLPMHSFFVLRRFIRLNEDAADSALVSGDANTAITRARENLAAGRHQLAQTGMIDLLMARIVIGQSAHLLVRAAQQGDDPLTAGAARRLGSLVAGSLNVDRNQLRAYRTLGSEPADGRLLAVASDTTLHPALRLMAFDGLLAGACTHPREVLFGMSNDRRVMFQQIAQAVEDLPRARDLAMLWDHDFDNFDNGLPPNATHVHPAAERAPSLLTWVVPRRVNDRVEMCRRI